VQNPFEEEYYVFEFEASVQRGTRIGMEFRGASRLSNADDSARHDAAEADPPGPGPRRYTDAELLDRFHRSKSRPASSETLGFHVLRVDQAAGEVEVEFLGRPEFCNPMGHVQGGFLAAMLDECSAVAGIVASGMTSAFPSLEMKISFLHPVKPGRIRGVGRVVKQGRTVCFLEGDLYGEDGKLAARGSVTSLPMPFKAAKPPPGPA